MARNGSGTYTRTDGVRSGSNVYAQQESAGVDIEAGLMDTAAEDIATALTASIAKDGQTNPTADLPMNGFIHTGVGTTDDRTGYAKAGELQDGTLLVLGVAGTNTLTATATPTITAYVNRQTFWITIANKNTSGTVSLNIDTVGAHNIVKPSGNALDIGDLQPNATYAVTYYATGTEFVLQGVVEVDGTTLTTNSTTGIVGILGGGVDTNQLAAEAVQPSKTDFLESGNVTKVYAAVTNGTTTLTEGPSGWTLTNPTNPGIYVVTHTFGDTGYAVVATSHAAETYISISSKDSNSFELTVTDAAGAQQQSVIDMIIWRY